MVGDAAQVVPSSVVGPQMIRLDGLQPAAQLHRFLKEFKGCSAIAQLGDDALQHFLLLPTALSLSRSG